MRPLYSKCGEKDLLVQFPKEMIYIRIKGEMGRECSTNGETRNIYRILLGKPNGKNH
jgi:hypothetical protein